MLTPTQTIKENVQIEKVTTHRYHAMTEYSKRGIKTNMINLFRIEDMITNNLQVLYDQ